MKKEVIKTEMTVKDTIVSVMRVGNTDYISLTDLAKFKNDKNPPNLKISSQHLIFHSPECLE